MGVIIAGEVDWHSDRQRADEKLVQLHLTRE